MADEHNGDISTLVAQAKAKCRITWDDAATDSRFEDEIVPGAVADVRLKVGIPDAVDFDFTASGIEHKLFLNACYYAWHDAEDDFGTNYAADIAHARRIWEVKNAQEEEGSSDLP